MSLLDLWLPVLLSSVAVFFASFVAWTILPHHKKDWRCLPDHDAFADAMKQLDIPPGQYLYPNVATNAEMKEEAYQQRFKDGPWGTLSVWPAAPNMGSNLLRTFSLYVLISVTVAYLSTLSSLKTDSSFMDVFRFAGTAAVTAYCFGMLQNAIWFKQRVLNDLIDGVVYGLITGAIFAALWPTA